MLYNRRVSFDPNSIPENFVPSTWQGEGNYWTGLGQDGSVVVNWSLGRPDGRRGELQVWFEADSNQQVSAVRVSLPDGLTPSGLGRFPWARMMAIADSAHVLLTPNPHLGSLRFFDYPESLRLSDAVEAAREGKRPPRGSRGSRPGRRGHPDSFYQGIATEYLAMRQKGVTNPTAALGEKRHVSRSTAAGWVGRARQRGYLPPGRPGRAG
jgi:hypothetical protein